MRLAHPIIAAAVALAACTNKAEVDEARRSLYDADFAVVYNATVAVVRELYPNMGDDPKSGRIATAWHPVMYRDPGADDPKSVQNQDQALGYDPTSTDPNSMAGPGGQASSVAHTRFFVRFDVTIAGGRPWHIRVVGHAQQWDAGMAEAVELKGPATPHWLPGRTDALIVAIHKRLKDVAILPPPDEVEVVDAPPPIDVTAFGPIAADAGKRLGEVIDSINSRDLDTLKTYVATDVVWSLGGTPGVDGAFAMWQADPAILDSMRTTIQAGCRGSETEVSCPPAASETPGFTGWRLTLTKRGEAWLITGFVQGD
jgi:hypothetical protein